MLIKLNMKTLDVTYIVDVPGDSRISVLRQEAANKFKIPEAAVKLSLNGSVLNQNESVCVQLKDGAIVSVEVDEENFESNEMQIKRDRLLKKLRESNDVQKLLQFYQQNQKVVQPFLLSAQDKLRKSLKIIKFVDELKEAPLETGEDLAKQQHNMQEQIAKADAAHALDCQQYFPETYLSYNLKDQLVEHEYDIEQAKKEINAQGENYPLALTGAGPLKPKSLKGPESDFYELQECEKQNITTVLVENLFSELAVMVILFQEILKSQEGRVFATYVEADQHEDLKRVNMVATYNLMELIDVKDMLLGQHVQRARKLDQGNIQLGFQAYINGLKKAYAEQLELVRMMGIDAPDAEVLQRIEANGGDAQKTARDFFAMK